MKRDLHERCNRTNTRLLMRVKNITWQDHQTKEQIYTGSFFPLNIYRHSTGRTHFEGHWARAQYKPLFNIISWRLQCSNKGRWPFTYMDIIAWDLQQSVGDIPNLMKDLGNLALACDHQSQLRTTERQIERRWGLVAKPLCKLLALLFISGNQFIKCTCQLNVSPLCL